MRGGGESEGPRRRAKLQLHESLCWQLRAPLLPWEAPHSSEHPRVLEQDSPYYHLRVGPALRGGVSPLSRFLHVRSYRPLVEIPCACCMFSFIPSPFPLTSVLSFASKASPFWVWSFVNAVANGFDFGCVTFAAVIAAALHALTKGG